MIPKIIHYCWFGRGEMPSLAIACIESWKKFLPEYELYLWNEDNFDVTSNQYVHEAYLSKKYAFVTDYVRLYAIYTIGGIYMDTDVEVLKPLDRFLDLPAFSGFEDEKYIPTGIMGSEKKGEWARRMLNYYQDKTFIQPNGEFDMTTNCHIITNQMVAEGFVLNNEYQNYIDIIHIFPNDFFCPKSYQTKEITITDNTYCIHHFAGSWVEKRKISSKDILLQNVKTVVKYVIFYGLWRNLRR